MKQLSGGEIDHMARSLLASACAIVLMAGCVVEDIDALIAERGVTYCPSSTGNSESGLDTSSGTSTSSSTSDSSAASTYESDASSTGESTTTGDSGSSESSSTGPAPP